MEKKPIPVAHVHTVRVRDKLWNALKTKAAKKEMRVSEAIIEALEDWMKK